MKIRSKKTNPKISYATKDTNLRIFASQFFTAIIWYICAYFGFVFIFVVILSYSVPSHFLLQYTYIRHIDSFISLRSQIYYRLFRWTCVCCLWCDNLDTKLKREKNRLEKTFSYKNWDFIVMIGFCTVKNI